MTAATTAHHAVVIVGDDPKRPGRFLYVAVCDDCAWTGHTSQRKHGPARERDRHSARPSTRFEQMPAPIRPTEPAEQPALF